MHCRSCEILVEDELRKITGVSDVKVNEKKGNAYVCYEGELDHQKIEEAVRNAGYELGIKEEAPLFSKRMQDYKELGFAFLVMVLLYMIGKELGVFNFAIKSGSNYGNLSMVLLVGLTAGVSTCMALVGGLVLAASARFVEKHPQASALQKFKPHIFFNLGRIISFFMLGGIIGYAGSYFQLSPTTLGLLTIAVGGVMVLMGLQLTEIFPRLSGLQFTLPKGISRALGIREQSEKEYSHTNAFILGASTFFLPCGFTQAMQLFAISSGNPMTGALTMSVFAVGTAPCLLGIGGLISIIKGAFAKPFFKFAGLIVIFMALFNISNGLNLAGIDVNAFLNQPSSVVAQADPNVTMENGVQVVKMIQNGNGYTPNSFTIKKGIPVKWIITSEDAFTCAASIVSSKLGIRKNLSAGENIIEFTPTEIGDARFTCSMGMYSGSFNIIEGDVPPSSNKDGATKQASVQTPTVNSGGSCTGGRCGCGQKAQRQAALDTDKTPAVSAEQKKDTQIIKAVYTVADDIKPNKFTVKAGTPIQFEIEAKEDGFGCMGSIMIPGLDNNPQGFEKGKITTLKFTPEKSGTYTITCAMGVPKGTIIAEI